MQIVRGSVAVLPAPSASSAQAAKPSKGRLPQLLVVARKAWWSVQVSRSGRYSLERLEKFRNYSATASPLRCSLICLLTPIPSMLFVVCLECLPLKKPDQWRSDAGIWLRMGFTAATMGFSYVLQLKQVIPECPISQLQAVGVGVSSSLMYLAFLLTLCWLWTFPIPFGFVVTAWPYLCCLVSSFLIVVGVAPLRCVPNVRAKLIQLIKVLMVQSMLVYIYPAFTIAFVQLEAHQRPFLLVLLPVIKLVLRNLMAHVCAATPLEDQVPEITVFSVELFNSLYITACVSVTSSAPAATAIIMAIDVFQSFLSFDAVKERAKHLERKAGLARIRDTTAASVRSDSSVREKAFATANATMESELQLITQKLHFSCEYLVLVEYIECFIPGICMIYTAILSQLPNAQFYPQMQGMHGEQLRSTVGSIAIYVLLETASLLAFCWFLRKKIRVHALYQLAFVLENQMLVIQAKLFVWVTYSLTFRLEHSGMDFKQITKLLGG